MDEAAARAAFTTALATYRQEFGTFFLARLLGLEIEYPGSPGDTCVITFTPKDFLFNPQGRVHGGVIATVMDISMGHLVDHVSGPAVTLEMKTQYLKAAGTGTLICTGRFLRRGRRISHTAAELVDADGDLVAFATATWRSLDREASDPSGSGSPSPTSAG